MTEAVSELRVLIVEDEPLVAMLTEDLLVELGHQAAVVSHGLRDGLAALDRGAFDLAMLDVNLGGTMSFPIADRAAEKGVPVLFVTGFGRDQVDRLAGECVLQKPYSAAQLERAIVEALERGPARG